MLIGVCCGVFLWVAQAPRSWQESWGMPRSVSVTPPPQSALALAPPVALTQPAKFRSLEELAVPRREADVLPLVARRVSLDAPALDAVAPAAGEDWSFAPPAAPDFGLAEEIPPNAAHAGDEPQDPVSTWPQAPALAAQLTELAERQDCANWALETRARIQRLSATPSLDSSASAAELDKLAELAAQAKRQAARLTSVEDQSRMLAAHYALSRRLAVWRCVHEAAGQPGATTVPVAAHPNHMLQRLEAADAVLGQGRRSSHWRRYLLTGQTRLLAEAGSTIDELQRRQHARRVLRRMEWPGLTDVQRGFLTRAEFADLAEELRAWAAEPFDFPQLLQTLEDYERQPSASLARAIASYRRRLGWASHRSVAELANQIDVHYANANVRAAVSQDLLVLLAETPETKVERVEDTIAGAAVRGQSQTTSQVAFRVLPDEHRLRLVLEATGQVVTSTRSSKSGAVFYSNGQAWFAAQKEIMFDGRNLMLAPAVAEARVNDSLRNIATEYDNVPLVNMLAQSIARQGHADAHATAQREARQKVARRAASQLDAEAAQRLGNLDARVRDVVGERLSHLALFADPVSLQTTESRLIGRYRLASDMQLGAHTARPQAPADSLASVQIHESAVNNALGQLRLAGCEMDLPGVFNAVIEAVGAAGTQIPDDLPENILVRFDEEEPLRVDLMDGQARVTIRLAELQTEDRTWRNIMSRAYYCPEATGMTARLARDGHIELSGDRLRFRDQLALRAIFAKVFSERRALDLIPPRLARNPKLDGCELTQLTIRDGWIGLAIGPVRAPRTAKK